MAYINCRKTTSVGKREEIIALWPSGVRQAAIPERVGLSRKTATNIVNIKFLQTGTLLPGKPGWKDRKVSTPEVFEFVEYCKTKKLSIQTSEIRQSLVDEGICYIANRPSRSTVGYILRNDLDFTFKKITATSEESLTNENLMKTRDYIMFMSGIDPSTIHFFDESSVAKTAGNGTYGHSKKTCEHSAGSIFM